jgi:hypothetical protein
MDSAPEANLCVSPAQYVALEDIALQDIALEDNALQLNVAH